MAVRHHTAKLKKEKIGAPVHATMQGGGIRTHQSSKSTITILLLVSDSGSESEKAG
jgi:hypothetical protein